MNKSKHATQSRFSRILHPSDGSAASRTAFSHALKIALQTRAELTLLHVDTHPTRAEHPWWREPHVGDLLRDWGLLDADAPASSILDEFGVNIIFHWIPADNPMQGIARYLDHIAADLIVLSTRGSHGLPRWLQPSVAEAVARHSPVATLFVPEQAKPFVTAENGSLSINRVLLPFDFSPSPRNAIEQTEDLLSTLYASPDSLHLVHVGKPDAELDRSKAEYASLPWCVEYMTGPVVGTILSAADTRQVDLIAMGTQGHDGFLDALRGSVTENVIRGAPCPVLAVPSIA